MYVYIMCMYICYIYRYTQRKRSTFCSTWARVVMMTMLIIQRWQMNCSKVVWWHKTWWKPPSIILRPPPRSWPSKGVAFRSTWDPPGTGSRVYRHTGWTKIWRINWPSLRSPKFAPLTSRDAPRLKLRTRLPQIPACKLGDLCSGYLWKAMEETLVLT